MRYCIAADDPKTVRRFPIRHDHSMYHWGQWSGCFYGFESGIRTVTTVPVPSIPISVNFLGRVAGMKDDSWSLLKLLRLSLDRLLSVRDHQEYWAATLRRCA